MRRLKVATYYPLTVKKHLRAWWCFAEQNHLPCIYLVDPVEHSYRSRPMSSPTATSGASSGNQARMPSQRIPQIAVVMGLKRNGGMAICARNER